MGNVRIGSGPNLATDFSGGPSLVDRPKELTSKPLDSFESAPGTKGVSQVKTGGGPDLVQQLAAYGVTVSGMNGKVFNDAELQTVLDSVKASATKLNEAATGTASDDPALFKQTFGNIEFIRTDEVRSGAAENHGNTDPRSSPRVASGETTFITLGDGVFNKMDGNPRATTAATTLPATGDALTPLQIITHEVAHTLNFRLESSGKNLVSRFTSHWNQYPHLPRDTGIGFEAGKKIGYEYDGREQLADAVANWLLDSIPADTAGAQRQEMMDGFMAELADQATVTKGYGG